MLNHLACPTTLWSCPAEFSCTRRSKCLQSWDFWTFLGRVWGGIRWEGAGLCGYMEGEPLPSPESPAHATPGRRRSSSPPTPCHQHHQLETVWISPSKSRWPCPVELSSVGGRVCLSELGRLDCVSLEGYCLTMEGSAWPPLTGSVYTTINGRLLICPP